MWNKVVQTGVEMREIGGYFELEHFHGNMMHENAIALNCGRNCLAYLIKAKKIRKLAVPYFMCDCIFEVCEKNDVELSYYHIKEDFMPDKIVCSSDTWIYIMNYYGQLTQCQLQFLKKTYVRIIIDNAQAYFDEPLEGIDTLYTCRKFFGVSDGAFLYTDSFLREELLQDKSYDRMKYLLGRYECSASEFYKESTENNELFGNIPIMRMSKITENILRAIDYEWIKAIRTENFAYLHNRLGKTNLLYVHPVEGAFAYPFMIESGSILRKKLVKEKIYIPVLWPNVLQNIEEKIWEYTLADNVLPIPCDQRYTTEDMAQICSLIEKLI